MTAVARASARLVGQHKIATSVGAVFAAAIVAVSLAGSRAGGNSPDAAPIAPAFTLAALGAPGRQVALSQYKGKPVIVNFWASWCQPCQQETPLLARWYTSQRGRVNLVGIDENDKAPSALEFARAKGVSYPVGFDPGLTAASAYGVSGLPQTFFLDGRHRIVDHVFGAVTQADLVKGVRLMGIPGPSSVTLHAR